MIFDPRQCNNVYFTGEESKWTSCHTCHISQYRKKNDGRKKGGSKTIDHLTVFYGDGHYIINMAGNMMVQVYPSPLLSCDGKLATQSFTQYKGFFNPDSHVLFFLLWCVCRWGMPVRVMCQTLQVNSVMLFYCCPYPFRHYGAPFLLVLGIDNNNQCSRKP